MSVFFWKGIFKDPLERVDTFQFSKKILKRKMRQLSISKTKANSCSKQRIES